MITVVEKGIDYTIYYILQEEPWEHSFSKFLKLNKKGDFIIRKDGVIEQLWKHFQKRNES